jgi:hypothetical protein
MFRAAEVSAGPTCPQLMHWKRSRSHRFLRSKEPQTGRAREVYSVFAAMPDIGQPPDATAFILVGTALTFAPTRPALPSLAAAPTLLLAMTGGRSLLLPAQQRRRDSFSRQRHIANPRA